MGIRKLKARASSPARLKPAGEIVLNRPCSGRSSCFQLPYVVSGMITRLKLL
jgi:hypothetical protein